MEQITYRTKGNANNVGDKQFGAGKFKVVPVGKRFAVEPLQAETAPPTVWPFPVVKAEQLSAPVPAWPWPKAEQFAQPVAKAARVVREERNGAKRPIKGVCAELWAHYDTLAQATIEAVKAHVEANPHLNLTNAKLEFYAWRKFNAPLPA